MSPDEVETILKANNMPFRCKDIQHARQFSFKDGAILCAYETGKAVWQGKASATKVRVEELLGHAPRVATVSSDEPSKGSPYSNKVFIVYGHDVDAREQLELLLRRMRLEPVVLQNVPSGGQTIIEKLETNSDVTFACVLLTPDDEGYPVGKANARRLRARQNVVLEMGMFLSKLGRKHVAVLHKGDLELPSDIHGLLYIQFKDRVDEIKERLAAELQEGGFRINIKDLLS